MKPSNMETPRPSLSIAAGALMLASLVQISSGKSPQTAMSAERLRHGSGERGRA